MTEGPVSPPCPLAGREAPSLWPVAADKQEKVNHAQGGSSQASASGWQWRVRQEQGGGKEESRRSLYPPGVWCVCVCVRTGGSARHHAAPPQGTLPRSGPARGASALRPERASARPSAGSPWAALARGWGPSQAGAGAGEGRLESKTLTPKTMSSPRLRQLIWSRPRFIKFS